MRLRLCLIMIALLAPPALGSPAYTVAWGLSTAPFTSHTEGPGGLFDDFLSSYSHPGFGVHVVALSSNGNVAGDAADFASDRIFPFIWKPTDTSLRFIPLLDGTREGYIADVNDGGQAVGTSVIFDHQEAWIYQDGRTTDLNDLIPEGPIGITWHLGTAEAIDGAGRITGQGTLGRYLLTPFADPPTGDPPTASSPEPATFLGGILGVLAMTGYMCYHTMKSRSA
jgi:probable HAF family extracellular repeat protein